MFQANAINNTQIDNDKDIDLVIMIIQKNQEVNDNMEMIQLLAVFQMLLEFEKWRAIRSGVGGVGGVLAWVACQRG